MKQKWEWGTPTTAIETIGNAGGGIGYSSYLGQKWTLNSQRSPNFLSKMSLKDIGCSSAAISSISVMIGSSAATIWARCASVSWWSFACLGSIYPPEKVSYSLAAFAARKSDGFREYLMPETGLPRISCLVLQPQLAMEGSSSAAVVTAFGPHLVTSSPARPV